MFVLGKFMTTFEKLSLVKGYWNRAIRLLDGIDFEIEPTKGKAYLVGFYPQGRLHGADSFGILVFSENYPNGTFLFADTDKDLEYFQAVFLTWLDVKIGGLTIVTPTPTVDEWRPLTREE